MNQMAPIGTREAAAAGVAKRLRATTRIAPNRIMTDALMTYAYAGDASQYRLVPAVVVIVNSEAEVLAVVDAARAERLPLTFRAAGTSLSGQSNTDGVLCVLGTGVLCAVLPAFVRYDDRTSPHRAAKLAEEAGQS